MPCSCLEPLRYDLRADSRAATHGDDLQRSLSSQPLGLGSKILFSLRNGDEQRFDSRRAEEAKSNIDVPRTDENEDFRLAELDSVLSVEP